MDVFDFRDQLVSEYERFSRSFARIRAEDIHRAVNQAYEGGRYWPSPMIQLNPNFEPGGSIDELVADGVLDPECSGIFRIGKTDRDPGEELVLHRHQVDAIEAARRRRNYVLTTGTGSGKSLAYFIPIIDDVLRRRRAGEKPGGIAAIVVYPMNALCNSQLEELEKFLRRGYGESNEPVTFARYTGQESEQDRARIAAQPPDILLTNYVMLELMMTRFIETDRAVRSHAVGLRYLVLDELHTYRGRQGADVAMLVRRVRERFNDHLLCIGTSATMASEGAAEHRSSAVADIAGRLFGSEVRPEEVIVETLAPVTQRETPIGAVDLRQAIRAGVPNNPTHDQLEGHPVAAWVERKLGLEPKDGGLVRISRPRTVEEASHLLAQGQPTVVGRMRQISGGVPFGGLSEQRHRRAQFLRLPTPSVHQRCLERLHHLGGPGCSLHHVGGTAIPARKPSEASVQPFLLPGVRPGIFPGVGQKGQRSARQLRSSGTGRALSSG